MSVWVLYWILAEERLRKSKTAMKGSGGKFYKISPLFLSFVAATLRRPPATQAATIFAQFIQ